MIETAVKEKPILFSGTMVQAIINKQKTVTRRLATKPVKHPDYGNLYAPGALALEREPQHVIDRCCPYGAPGDRLWVRESFAECTKAGGHIIYKADGEGIGTCHVSGGRWKPSIHMPRRASRITLEVTDVRVERLHAITPAGAIAEGIGPFANSATIDCDTINPRDVFAGLWNEINGKRASWESNPWVWRVAFKVVEVKNNA